MSSPLCDTALSFGCVLLAFACCKIGYYPYRDDVWSILGKIGGVAVSVGVCLGFVRRTKGNARVVPGVSLIIVLLILTGMVVLYTGLG